jgi:hypothetical protein
VGARRGIARCVAAVRTVPPRLPLSLAALSGIASARLSSCADDAASAAAALELRGIGSATARAAAAAVPTAVYDAIVAGRPLRASVARVLACAASAFPALVVALRDQASRAGIACLGIALFFATRPKKR